MYYDYLTVSARRKTDKLIEKKRKINMAIKKEKIYLGILIIFVLYFIILDNALIHNIVELSEIWNSDYSKLGFLDKTILASSVFTFILIVYQANRVGTLKKEYEKLRIDIIVQMGQNFCLHKDNCDCIDKYILEMDKQDIDVVFR